MEPRSAPHNTVWPFPFTPQDWAQTPTAVQAYVHILPDELTQLRARVEVLEARLMQNSTTSQRPPSSDAPYKKPRQRPTMTPRRKAGGNQAIQAIARCCCPRQRCMSSGLSGVRVGIRPLPRLGRTIRTKCWNCRPSSWRYGTSYCIRGGVRSVVPRTMPTFPPSMRPATDHDSSRSWASWRGRTGTAAAWCKPCAPRSSQCP